MLKQAFETMAEALKREKNVHMDDGAADNSPEKAFKEIVVDGKVLATIYITGVSSMTLEAAQKLAISGLELPSGGGGMQSAMTRVEFLAKALGGEIRDAVKPKSPSSTSSPTSFSTFSSSLPSISRFKMT
ncbi:hypothetical protein [Achromobacter anxifer]